MNDRNRQNARILFGLKVKQLRQKLGFSFADLSREAGLSVSYLNEIEKGKKFPKEEKLAALARALGTDQATLLSVEEDEGLLPVVELLRSNFLNELPLDLFGIDLSKVVEIIAGAPARVGAFISTLLEISRNYALQEENFYFSALRSYLELHSNYFPELEAAVQRFMEANDLPADRPLDPELLRKKLESLYGYEVIEDGLDQYPELRHLRSVYLPAKRQLLLNGGLTDIQRNFQLGKELGLNYLELKDRGYTSSLLRSSSFEEVLNHSQAIYFSVALHLPLAPLRSDMETFFARPRWDAEAFLKIMDRYAATPEMFYHRLTNILPQFLGMRKLFFFRFVHDIVKDSYEIDKELHLNHRHQPHGNGLFEHYCRRWVSVSALKELREQQKGRRFVDTIARVQISRYAGAGDAYLCLTIARPAYPSPNKNVSVTIGLLLDDELRRKVRFSEDPAIPHREVNTTCERCPLADCKDRAARPVIVEKREQLRAIRSRLEVLNAE